MQGLLCRTGVYLKRVPFVYPVMGVVLLIISSGCARSPEGQVTILHTNDMHGQYAPLPALWMDAEPKPLIGGIAALDYYIQRQKAQAPYVLLLDAGDISTGTPLSKIVRDGVMGGGYADMLNMIGYDAQIFGNHEFDEGQENLTLLMKRLGADVLNANLEVRGALLAEKPYKIFHKGGLRIGVIGLILQDLDQNVALKHLADVEVKAPSVVAQQAIDEIDPMTDLIVLLTHEGLENDRELARKVRHADVIVGGHSHTRLEKPESENGVLIVQADAKTRYLGRLALTVQDDHVSRYEYELIPTWVEGAKTPRKEVQALVDEYRTLIEAQYNQVIGVLQTDWKRYDRGESNIGNFIADAMRAATGTDFAVINSGGIRKDVPAGPVTKLDIMEILPFTNYLVTFECTGSQLLTLMQNNARMAVDRDHGILQVSGLHMTFRREKNAPATILAASVNGRPVQAGSIYTGTTVDFISFGQALTFFGFEPSGMQNTDVVIADAVAGHILKYPQVISRVEGRIIEAH